MELEIQQTPEAYLAAQQPPTPPKPEAETVRQAAPLHFMDNVPTWLQNPPELTGQEESVECQVLVVGAGQAGTIAALRLAETGADVLCIEAQSWERYDVYPTDMAVYNSKFFLDRGTPAYDPLDIFNEYMSKALGHAHPQLVRDYAFRSGEMFDWMLTHIPQELTEAYAHPVNYRGNPGFSGETCGQKSFIGMVQWRDQETNKNIWGYVMRHLIQEAHNLGARFRFHTKALRILQAPDGTVTGCLVQDSQGKQLVVRCKAVLVCAGDYGGNREMLLDLSDHLRNLAWSFGRDRTDPHSVTGGGRDGSGIKMCLWAGGTMEAGPRAGQGGFVNRRPEFGFGGCWPCFGPDGKRFMNETVVRYGATGACDMLPVGGIMTLVTDANWDRYLDRQGYGHEMMDRSNDAWHEMLREDMRHYKTGKDGFPVHCFGVTGIAYFTCWAADTLEELGETLGYQGEALQSFLREVERYNRFCAQGRDEDWGCDPGYLFPILEPPFFGVVNTVSAKKPNGGLCQHAGVCTDGHYNVVDANKQPIPGLYAAGNCCGQRYAVQYHTPTAGNSCGSALTTGYVAAEHIAEFLKLGLHAK